MAKFLTTKQAVKAYYRYEDYKQARLEWQSYFHTDPMFKEIVHYDGEWVKNSFITLSEKPGIGVEINEDAMKKYAVPGIPFFV